MGGRDFPESAYLDMDCPKCGTQMMDVMGDDVCPECQFEHEEDDLLPASLGHKKKRAGAMIVPIMNVSNIDAALEDANKILDSYASQAGMTQATLLEMLAAAYLKATDIDPRDAILISKIEKDGMRFWFERKTRQRAEKA